jgi:type III restriction enzyme
MQAKEFQQRALDILDVYLQNLVAAKELGVKREKLRKENPDDDIPLLDFPAKAWEETHKTITPGRKDLKTNQAFSYSPRKDGMDRPVPNVTFKVPTGGGKTFLAVQALSKVINTYFGPDDDHFILWIVPSEAIYTQTKRALLNRDNGLRKALDIETGGRVKIMEKNTPFHKDDLKGHLTIMLLMLPSAARKDAVDKLKLFKDRGDVNGFFPVEDNVLKHREYKELIPNLDTIDIGDVLFGTAEGSEEVGLVRSSLGNALRLLQPMIVMDEGHKGFAEISHNAIYQFNPRFVLELSATPKDGNGKHANWLVNVTGTELHKEEMIKMPIELDVSPDNSWHTCLRNAWQKVVALQESATKLFESEGRYIRPILLVQVESVGADQRDKGTVHAEDAREYLQSLGISEEAIKVKTSDLDELKILEVTDLLSEKSLVRVIITKQALQEGWDCPFAYVLCSLAASKSASAMTQLVGRILRQPHAKRTGVPELDQCYVFTYRHETKEIVDYIKKGLENEGMGDIAGAVVTSDSPEVETITRHRKPGCIERKYYLPQVLVHEGESKTRQIDWETDILGSVDWDAIEFKPLDGVLPKGNYAGSGELVSISLAENANFHEEALQSGIYASEFNMVFAARALREVVPNPFVCGKWVSSYIECLLSSGWTEEDLAKGQRYVLDQMEKRAKAVLEEVCCAVFEASLNSNKIIFDLVLDKWWEVPHVSKIEIPLGEDRKRRGDRNEFEKAMFSPVFPSEFTGLEYKVASFVDRQEAVSWWYRNVVKSDGYGIQGWRKNKIYPDFVFAVEKDNEVEQWYVIETKGDQLIGNLDTKYKSSLMTKLTESYTEGAASKIGQLTLFEKRAAYHCELIAETDWELRMNKLFEDQN